LKQDLEPCVGTVWSYWGTVL